MISILSQVADWLRDNPGKADAIKTGTANSLVLGAVTLTNIELIGRLALLALTIGYTVWKWRKEAK